RKRKYFADLEKVFLKYEIPFTIIGGRGFYQRQTITDIFNYLSFLADKNNNTALIGLLRSPFFTVSDAKLFEISLKPGRNFWKKINTVSDDVEIISICILLKENLSISNSISLPQLIDKIITDRNYLSILAVRNDGDQEIANIAKLVSIARNFNATGFRNFYDFLNFLKESITDLSDESQASITINADAIQMMTIHQSKGLEFPVVFLYKTDESGISGAVKSGEVKIDKKFGAITKVPLNQDYIEDYHSAPIAALHNYFEEKKNNAELKRLLYVAVTRAKDELYISASIKNNSSFKKDSFINLLSDGLRNDFSTNEITINEQLEYLKIENDNYINRVENVNLIIPITTQLDFVEREISRQTQQKENIKFNTSVLHSREKGEIISASKVSIYSQCPLKYLLTYDYGFGKLNSDYRNYSLNTKQYQYNSITVSEDDNLDDRFEPVGKETHSNDSALFGKIFHKVMEGNISVEKLDEYLKNQLEFSLENITTSEKMTARLKSDLINIYQSETWKMINQYPNYKNEFEIYVREKDYYLHGIIDKIIFSEKKILIFDYKTDDIEKKEIKKHSEYYLMQLKFYLYIASRLFSEFDTFEGSLVFVKHPADIVTIIYNKNEIKNLEKEIAGIINSIRNKNSEKNYNHCKVCSFSGSSNKCIIN
ncbi:MAG: 3'-5' exonuclease, partial [Ignavibacteria bacterium]|nr:3'-5' exonuclease [Ignavibacteria bacterium]